MSQPKQVIDLIYGEEEDVRITESMLNLLRSVVLWVAIRTKKIIARRINAKLMNCII